jgi:hypothetical protein
VLHCVPLPLAGLLIGADSATQERRHRCTASLSLAGDDPGATVAPRMMRPPLRHGSHSAPAADYYGASKGGGREMSASAAPGGGWGDAMPPPLPLGEHMTSEMNCSAMPRTQSTQELENAIGSELCLAMADFEFSNQAAAAAAAVAHTHHVHVALPNGTYNSQPPTPPPSAASPAVLQNGAAAGMDFLPRAATAGIVSSAAHAAQSPPHPSPPGRWAAQWQPSSRGPPSSAPPHPQMTATRKGASGYASPHPMPQPSLPNAWAAVLGSSAGPELMPFLSERETRALVLWNTPPSLNLRAMCEAYGEVFYLRTDFQSKGVVFVAYYDVRAAVRAHQGLQHDLIHLAENRDTLPSAHFIVPLHAASMYREGALLLRTSPHGQVHETEVAQACQDFGTLRGVVAINGGILVEFFDIREGQTASLQLAAGCPWGLHVVIEAARRSESERSLGRQLLAVLERWQAQAHLGEAAVPISHSSPSLSPSFAEGAAQGLQSGVSMPIAVHGAPSGDKDWELSSTLHVLDKERDRDSSLSSQLSGMPSSVGSSDSDLGASEALTQVLQGHGHSHSLPSMPAPSSSGFYADSSVPVQMPRPIRYESGESSSNSDDGGTPADGTHFHRSHSPSDALSQSPIQLIGAINSCSANVNAAARRSKRESTVGAGSGGGGDTEFQLDVKKITRGLDRRTTIMIRNIPNKYTQAMLLQEIDMNFKEAYDFFYLPIDFKNRCNVGYAFINFMDCRRIVPFYREFNGQRWKNFNSEKVCAISYARIQVRILRHSCLPLWQCPVIDRGTLIPTISTGKSVDDK